MKAKHLVIFLAILGAGLFIEGLKRLSGVAGSSNDPTTVVAKGVDHKPFRISRFRLDNETDRSHSQTKKARGMSLNAVSTAEAHRFSPQISAQMAKLLTPSNKTPDTAKKTINKKKKTSARQNLKKNPKPESIANKSEIKKPYRPTQWSNQTTTGDNLQTAVNEEPSKTTGTSYEDWAKLILGSAQPDNVEKLVESYKTGKTSAEVFYAILSAMMNEENSSQHKLAVTAADKVQSLQSFVFLFAVLKSEDQGTELAQLSAQLLDGYYRLNLVGFVRGALQNHMDDTTFVQFALNIIDRSTQVYIEARKPAATQGSTPIAADILPNQQSPTVTTQNPTAYTPEQLNRLRKEYLPFQNILGLAVKNYTGVNAFVVESAQRSLNRIKTIAPPVVPDQSKG